MQTGKADMHSSPLSSFFETAVEKSADRRYGNEYNVGWYRVTTPLPGYRQGRLFIIQKMGGELWNRERN